MTYSEDIKRLRRDAKLFKKDLAKEVGISREYMGKIEKGDADIRVSMLQNFAKVFKKKLLILFVDE